MFLLAFSLMLIDQNFFLKDYTRKDVFLSISLYGAKTGQNPKDRSFSVSPISDMLPVYQISERWTDGCAVVCSVRYHRRSRGYALRGRSHKDSTMYATCREQIQLEKIFNNVGQQFNLLQSFNYLPYLFYKKRSKSAINSFCIWTRNLKKPVC
jgi:hypothetical protein